MTTSLPKNYEAIQQHYTSNSRGTRMGRRVARNVAEMAQYLKPPILSVGCGDGWELEMLAQTLKVPATSEYVRGIEVTAERVTEAQSHQLDVQLGSLENFPELCGEKRYNIYCAHTLEHSFDKVKAIENLKQVALDTVVLIIPVEIHGKSRNRAHYSPIANLGYLANLFGMNWKVVNMMYRWNVELEGVLVLNRNPVTWPAKLAGRTGDLVIPGAF